MLQQFQNVLDQPHFSQTEVLQSTRNLILNSLQNNFPPDFNFDGLAALCNDPKIASNEGLLTYHLVDYFIQLIQANFVPLFNYQSLQNQTQKLESTIRSHIRLQQEVKMYLQHLEYKLNKYENYLQHCTPQPFPPSTESIPSQQETQLRKQQVSLVRTNEKLKRQLQQKQQQIHEKDQQLSVKINELARLKNASPNSLQNSADLLKKSLQLGNAKSQRKLQPVTKVLTQSRQVKEGEKEGESLLINISGNNNEVNCYVAKSD